MILCMDPDKKNWIFDGWTDQIFVHLIYRGKDGTIETDRRDKIIRPIMEHFYATPESDSRLRRVANKEE